jgi:TRAP-type mannitol/chloroaromatic compound transport system permease small subunit
MLINVKSEQMNFDLLRTCLFVMPFSVIVSRRAAIVLEKINVWRSTRGAGGEFNELHVVLFVCTFPSYNSIDAVERRVFFFRFKH